MVAWTTPITWANLDPITETKLNQQLRDNMLWLKSPAKGMVTIRNVANVTVTSTSFVAVDDAQFTIDADFTGGDISLEFNGTLSPQTVQAYFDVLIDGTTFASSMTATALTNGLWSAYATGTDITFNFHHRITGLAAGTHNFKLRARVASGSVILRMLNTVTQFMAIER